MCSSSKVLCVNICVYVRTQSLSLSLAYMRVCVKCIYAYVVVKCIYAYVVVKCIYAYVHMRICVKCTYIRMSIHIVCPCRLRSHTHTLFFSPPQPSLSPPCHPGPGEQKDGTIRERTHDIFHPRKNSIAFFFCERDFIRKKCP